MQWNILLENRNLFRMQHNILLQDGKLFRMQWNDGNLFKMQRIW